MISRHFRRQQVELSDLECNQIATLAVEVGGAHILEIFSPARFTTAAPKWGLRPGFAVDLSETKPFGPNMGAHWELKIDEDIEELEQMLEYEKPTLLAGSPPCAPYSLLPALAKDKQPAEETADRLEVDRRYLHTSVRAYRKQHAEGRLFLHEHSESATSWDPEIIALQIIPGVFTVCGPMCSWNMRTEDANRSGLVYKRTKWVTNSPGMARLLAQGCKSRSGSGYHVHIDLFNGVAKQAACHPPELIAGVLRELKGHLVGTCAIGAVEMRAAGPEPTQENWNEWSDETWNDVATFFDNISGEQLPTDKVLDARCEELRWCHDIQLYTKVLRSVAIHRGIKPVPTGWVDMNKRDRDNYNVRSRLVGNELKWKTKEQLLAHGLFSPMPPWEMVKVLLGFLVTDDFNGIAADDLVIGIFDISRAHFMAPADRELYIELPEEDKLPGEGDVVGRLNRMMYVRFP